MPIEYMTAGESHGEMLVGIIENIPVGLEVDADYIDAELKRRMLGLGRGARMQIENDKAEIVAGVRGKTALGSPIAVLIKNEDHKNWANTVGYGAFERDRAVTAARPGHADLAGVVKYGFDDARNVAERASARNTAMTVALGAVCKLYLKELGIEIASHTAALGIVKAERIKSFEDINARADGDRVRCLDPQASARMVDEIRMAALSGDTLGGVAEIIVTGCKSGIGSYIQSGARLDGALMSALGCIPSVKAVEIGDAVSGSALYGSAFHDALSVNGGKYCRTTNRAGGIEGGMTNGENIVVRLYFKPIPTLKNGLDTIDIKTKKQTKAASERSDVACVPAGGVIGEAATALVLAKALSAMLGGDTMDEVKERYDRKANSL